MWHSEHDPSRRRIRSLIDIATTLDLLARAVTERGERLVFPPVPDPTDLPVHDPGRSAVLRRARPIPGTRPGRTARRNSRLPGARPLSPRQAVRRSHARRVGDTRCRSAKPGSRLCLGRRARACGCRRGGLPGPAAGRRSPGGDRREGDHGVGPIMGLESDEQAGRPVWRIGRTFARAPRRVLLACHVASARRQIRRLGRQDVRRVVLRTLRAGHVGRRSVRCARSFARGQSP